MTSARWHPWRALRGRPHIEYRLDPAGEHGGGALHGRLGDRSAIVISPSLSRVERNAALAHELVHDERGVSGPHATAATMQTEERQVRQETARRLVPLDELLAFVEARVTVEPVTVAMAAEEFEVPPAVAAEALHQLQALLLERELRQTG